MVSIRPVGVPIGDSFTGGARLRFMAIMTSSRPSLSAATSWCELLLSSQTYVVVEEVLDRVRVAALGAVRGLRHGAAIGIG